ncbi:MAG: hypothetical protein ABL959_07755 [Pyrinomonadaceae bacterium]
MNWKVKKFTLLAASLLLACLLGLLIYLTGLIDYIPQLRASAQSPDGELSVSVYQKRMTPRPFFARMGAYVQIIDQKGALVYKKEIYHDDDFDDTVGVAFKDIVFEGDEIRIGPGVYIPNKYFIIKRSELGLKK